VAALEREADAARERLARVDADRVALQEQVVLGSARGWAVGHLLGGMMA
jgi:hypothetical protein